MLTSIDTSIIKRAQWLVRQIELFTKKQREDVGYHIVILNRLLGLVVLFLLMISFVKPSYSSILLFLVLFLQIKSLSGYTDRSVGTQEKTPIEIVKRRSIRLCGLCFLCAGTPAFILALYSTMQNRPELLILASVVTATLTLSILLSVATEYFLCTTSLSPQEKVLRQKIDVSSSPSHKI